MNTYIMIGIITIITGFFYSTFVSSWTRANREIGMCLGDGKRINENPVQNVITPRTLTKIQGLFGFGALLAQIVPFIFFYIGGINITKCVFWLVIAFLIRLFITYKVKVLTVLKVDYNDLINRYADYKRDKDTMREEAIKPYVEVMEELINFFEFLKANNLDVCLAHIHYWQDFLRNSIDYDLIELYKNCFNPKYTVLNNDISLIAEYGINNIGTIRQMRTLLKIDSIVFVNILNYNQNFIEDYIDDSIDSMLSYRKILYDIELNRLLVSNDDEAYKRIYNQMLDEFETKPKKKSKK